MFGIDESDNDGEQIKSVFGAIECANVVPEKTIRLGKPWPRTRKMVVLKSQQEKNTILKNASKLKNNEHYRTVYVKKDQMPHERKEWARLRAVLKVEKTRPVNAAVSVRMD